MPSNLAEIDPPQPSTEPALAPLKLNWLERRAFHFDGAEDDPAMARGDTLVEVTARALAGTDREEVRLRMTAKALAVSRAKLLAFEMHLDQCYGRGKDAEIRRALKMVEAARRYFLALLAEHRHACEGGRRAPVKITVGQAGAVNVMAVGGER